jgi:hypothetical protein
VDTPLAPVFIFPVIRASMYLFVVLSMLADCRYEPFVTLAGESVMVAVAA